LEKPNAALSGEQRRPLHLKYCAVNTKPEANQKCRALGIRLKRFVISQFRAKPNAYDIMCKVYRILLGLVHG
ncbi:hypothetical protein, partial [Vibrio genomosp. F6]|uniref:hypothetical protein n=1 Tax=Vibrio genomosp. F6 TaxID=723172 RepID=UPI0019D0111F